MTVDDFTAMLREGVSFSRPPQTAYEYSNLGYALLGRIITNVSGRPFDQYIQAEIMAPLGMASTGYEVSEAPIERRAIGYRWENDAHAPEPTMGHGVFGAMGGVQTSINDYARWIAFLLDAWPPRNGPEHGLVRRSSVRELAQGLNFPRLYTDEREGPDGLRKCALAWTYGMGLNPRDDCDLGFALTHASGYPGYGSYVLLMPDSGVLGKTVENNIIRIAPHTAFAKESEDAAKAKESELKAVPLDTRIFPISYADVSSIEKAIKDAKILSSRGSVSIDKRTSSVAINDVASVFSQIENLLAALDKPTPQVLIEARIVEAFESDVRCLGIQWGISTDGNNIPVGTAGTQGPFFEPPKNFVVDLPSTEGIAGGIAFGFLNEAKTQGVELVLTALETRTSRPAGRSSP